jgi:hypothetical protein
MQVYKNSNYAISPEGVVRNTKTNKILKAHDNGKGYQKVQLIIEGKRKSLYLQRLVADLYLPRPRKAKCDQVNHKDGNKANNHVNNLEWMTNGENQIHAHKEGLKPKAKLGRAQVKLIRGSNAEAKQLAKLLKVSISTIYAVKNRKIYKYF